MEYINELKVILIFGKRTKKENEYLPLIMIKHKTQILWRKITLTTSYNNNIKIENQQEFGCLTNTTPHNTTQNATTKVNLKHTIQSKI